MFYAGLMRNIVLPVSNESPVGAFFMHSIAMTYGEIQCDNSNDKGMRCKNLKT